MIPSEAETRMGVLLAPFGVLGVTPSSFRSMPGPPLLKMPLNRIVLPLVPGEVATPGPPLKAMMLPSPSVPIVAATGEP